MKKIVALLSIMALVSCGGSSTTDQVVTDSVVTDTVIVDSVPVVDSVSMNTAGGGGSAEEKNEGKPVE